MRCRRSDKGGRPATGFHNSESTGVLHPASWPARALEARVMRRADKQVGWGPDGWKAAALAAFIVPGASAAWSWAASIGLELSRRSAFQTHISGVWVQGHEWQAGRRHCGLRGLIVQAQITSNVLVRAPPLHIWPKMSRHMKGDLYEGHTRHLL